MISAFIISALVVALDISLKYLVYTNMSAGDTIPVIKGVLNITYVQNTGAAFGILSQHRWIFLVLSCLLIVLVALFILLCKNYHRLTYISAALVLGGGIGNMVDRIALGYVVDYIDFKMFDFWVWVFNAADAAVCIGAALFVIYLVFFDGKMTKAGKKAVLFDRKVEKDNE